MTPQESNVHPLPESKGPEPVQFTVRVVLDDGRDITATVAHYSGNVNALLDRTMDTLDRMRARCEIPRLEEAIYKGKKLLAEAEAAIVRVDAETEAKIEALKKEALDQAQKYQAKFSELENETREGHKFDPTSPGNRRHLDPITRKIAELEGEIDKLKDGAGAERGNFEATKLKQLEDIAELERRLDIRKKIVA